MSTIIGYGWGRWFSLIIKSGTLDASNRLAFKA
jgi:hypothetical protein